MKATEGRQGRVFVMRLEDGDMLPDCIERFATEKEISVGYVIVVGGIGEGEVVVGPRHSSRMPPYRVSAIGFALRSRRGNSFAVLYSSLSRISTLILLTPFRIDFHLLQYSEIY